MKAAGKYFVSKRIVMFETIVFAFIIVLLWFDEIMGVPFLDLQAGSVFLNWGNPLFKSMCILIAGAISIYNTNKMFKRLTYLEGILSICSSCKRIRDEKGDWHRIESYICKRSDAQFSHGICPECAAILYPESNPYRGNKQSIDFSRRHLIVAKVESGEASS